MTRTTPPRPLDVAAAFPALGPYRREAVRLHPRQGDPGPRDSSLGGPLWWPAAEPWPLCWEVHPATAAGGAVPLVPVLQLFAADLPELPFPAGSDVLHVLWCAVGHPDGPGPEPLLSWHHSSAGSGEWAVPRPPVGAVEHYLPVPCVLHPERVSEYPGWDLPEELDDALAPWFDRLEETIGWSYEEHLSVADGVKVGGYPTWGRDPQWPDCRGCRRRMEHLLTVGNAEFDGGTWRSWLPVEDTPATGTVWDLPVEQCDRLRNPSGLRIGDLGAVHLFTCPHCPDRPYAHRFGA
ncbi:DUF1963 domain-containing protein [Kitasatospora camelliae]|uniref:DUF1963 domain-containing protein n=1 Tax=Kitasatospora camelliae TaxID=3156397 RepID=A0AAU8K580_9ACTN